MNVKTETLIQFYERTNQQLPPQLARKSAGVSHFNVKRRSCVMKPVPYSRRDYYKICLVRGTGIYRFREQQVMVDKPAVIFSNPLLSSSLESTSAEQRGYYCLFNDAFLINNIRHDITLASALFNPTIVPIIFLDEVNAKRVENYFIELESLHAMDYRYKYDMIRNVLQLLIMEGIRLQSGSTKQYTVISSHRLVNKFFTLLNQQFPIDSPENPLTLISPSDYAAKLNVHVNHLNAMVKKYTSSSTTSVLKERIMAEAKALLSNTDWDISEVAYSLGFEYLSYFIKYFKQHASVTPLRFRELNRNSFD